MRIQKEYPKDGSQFWDIPDEQISFVGGKEGVFATWKVGHLIYMAAGDDGGWWEIACYSERWLPLIITNLQGYLSK